MRAKLSRSALVGVLVIFATATALAQRGGYRSQSYSGNLQYDGKFQFVRISYPWYGRQGAPWAHDYPRGEDHFTRILSEITAVPTHTDGHSIMGLSDPEIFKNPLIYMAEPGTWSMSDEDVKNLRAYLQKGGFLILDDNRYNHWGNIDLQVSKLFPEGRWVELDGTHQVFHSFFEIPHPEQIPQYYDPPPPHFLALYRGQQSEQADDDPLQLQHRHVGVLGVLGHRLQARGGEQHRVQGRHQRVHLRHHSLKKDAASKGDVVDSTTQQDRSHGFARGYRARRQDECRPQAHRGRARQAHRRPERTSSIRCS